MLEPHENQNIGLSFGSTGRAWLALTRWSWLVRFDLWVEENGQKVSCLMEIQVFLPQNLFTSVIFPISKNGIFVKLVIQVRKLRVIFVSSFPYTPYLKFISKYCVFHLQNLSCIETCLSRYPSHTIIYCPEPLCSSNFSLAFSLNLFSTFNTAIFKKKHKSEYFTATLIS